MSIEAITAIVTDVPAVADQLHRAFGWPITQQFDTFAELNADGFTLWLNAPGWPAPIPAAGVIIHHQVEDVAAATERARAAGATITREPTKMDFGTESAYALVAGLTIDLHRPLPAGA